MGAAYGCSQLTFSYASCIVVSGHVSVALHLVVDVLAVRDCISANAYAEANLGAGNEERSFMVLKAVAECVAALLYMRLLMGLPLPSASCGSIWLYEER